MSNKLKKLYQVNIQVNTNVHECFKESQNKKNCLQFFYSDDPFLNINFVSFSDTLPSLTNPVGMNMWEMGLVLSLVMKHFNSFPAWSEDLEL